MRESKEWKRGGERFIRSNQFHHCQLQLSTFCKSKIRTTLKLPHQKHQFTFLNADHSSLSLDLISFLIVSMKSSHYALLTMKSLPEEKTVAYDFELKKWPFKWILINP